MLRRIISYFDNGKVNVVLIVVWYKNADVHRNIALIGAGHWGQNYVRVLSEMGALSWVCDRDPEVLSSIAHSLPDVNCTGDISDVLNNDAVQGVVIATPNGTHFHIAKIALLHGKDVLVEKPMCLELEEGLGLVSLSEESGTVLMVGHLMHYHPAIIKLKTLVESGELGTVKRIRSERCNTNSCSDECALRSFAVHDLSLLPCIAGDSTKILECSGVLCDAHTYRSVHIRLACLEGASSEILAAYESVQKVRRMVIVGSEHTAVFDDVADDKLILCSSVPLGSSNDGMTVDTRKGTVVPIEQAEPLRLECEHFVHCMQTRKTPLTDGKEALRVLSLVDSARKLLENDLPCSSAYATSVYHPSLSRNR
ncbi:MAG: Gfo/Idh/MocA family oxidoreductase [Patescibacteria group bacterium]